MLTDVCPDAGWWWTSERKGAPRKIVSMCGKVLRILTTKVTKIRPLLVKETGGTKGKLVAVPIISQTVCSRME
ncbi:hypothetical protein ZHAS_00004341 [Anopheles sinensis]|uniref:Uncharacterized protein n=1 Tax=Anopheles sinensis TaxID=74873 RepID=A0A084VGN5_ANOSI|nr:hypothetical protein ZHAS_00004341 [Anopheles sinensis]